MSTRSVRLAAVAGGMVVLLGVAGLAVLALRGNAGDGPAAPPVESPTLQPSVTPEPGPDGGYGPAPDLCEAGDFTAAFEILPLAELTFDEEREGSLYRRTCDFELRDGESIGLFSVEAVLYSSPDRSGAAYRDAVAAPVVDGEQQEVTGDWDEASVFGRDRGDQADVELVMRDGVLLLYVVFAVSGDAADLDGQQEAAFQAAATVREMMRR